jgi:hypothetical protein
MSYCAYKYSWHPIKHPSACALLPVQLSESHKWSAAAMRKLKKIWSMQHIKSRGACVIVGHTACTTPKIRYPPPLKYGERSKKVSRGVREKGINILEWGSQICQSGRRPWSIESASVSSDNGDASKDGFFVPSRLQLENLLRARAHWLDHMTGIKKIENNGSPQFASK